MVRVAIAGSGDLARYLCEEMTKAGHQVLVLTRSRKAQFEQPNVVQAVTDYTLQSLTSLLADYEVLISTILDYSSSFVDVHHTLIQACQQSPHCRRFIPSEFSGDVAEFPNQPAFYRLTREPIRQLLREQGTLEWTLVAVGWLIDYVLPARNRYLTDIGEKFPLDLAQGRFIIPGTGDEPVDVTWARDVGKGLAQLVNAPTWEPYTYISGEKTCWNRVTEAMQKYYPDFKIERKAMQILEDQFSKDADDVLLAEYQLFSVSGAASLPESKVQQQRKMYFDDIHFQTLQDGLAQYEQNPHAII